MSHVSNKSTTRVQHSRENNCIRLVTNAGQRNFESMKGPLIAMYKVNPFCDQNSHIDLPDCMYKMPNIHKAPESSNQGSSIFEALELHQEHILKCLEELKVDLQKISNQITGSEKSQPARSCEMPERTKLPLINNPFHQNGIVQDIVISANLNQPLLSQLLLYQLLSQQMKVMTSSNIHSSIKELPSHFNGLLSFQINGLWTDHHLVLTLIWKNVEYGPHLIVNPQLQMTIQGESNIARFLARLLKPNYEDNAIEATQIDNWLDLASISCIYGSNKE